MQATIVLSSDEVLDIVIGALKARGLEVTGSVPHSDGSMNVTINVVSTAPAKRTRKAKPKAVELPNLKESK